jgi:hypothetical protein
MDAYDSLGGPSSSLNVVLTEHLGARAAGDTRTSGSVGGESWERDRLTGADEAALAAQRGTGGLAASAGSSLPSGAPGGSGVDSLQWRSDQDPLDTPPRR